MPDLHIVSWNVNGIRAILKKDFLKDISEMESRHSLPSRNKSAT